ncbi:hypothetical protein QTP70_021261 [Hemibagrus guttatus]|uniref:Signal peptidase complex catalytic subunit SEC11 n=1 Tax=Hemibagrus guttatus TaxID=175788 RepID=A0AAE0RCX9_9TELE|nr:hypothetical protein QTP70_021261 [Hemibagrus guttatus]
MLHLRCLLYYQVLNFGMIVSSALMIWKGLMVVTGSESPIVVVLSGSMEPAFHRGDLLFLTNRVEDPIRVGEIVVFRIEGREIPIVHRVLKIHENTNFIPDRSRPGLTTTAIGAVDLQGAGGNWATVGRRSRGGRRVRRQREKRKGKSVGLRIGTLNVGTMTGKGRELADVMERRKVDILCVQETRWKGSKARSIGAGFKLFYYGVDSKRNGVGVVLKEEFVRNVLEVKRVSDRVMSLKLEFEGVMLNVVSGYAPQVGCELEEKERFWSELDEVMESIPTGERVVIGVDFNGHVGEGNTGDEEVMGKFGVKERNLEGQMVVDFAKRMDMAVVNTYFQKREEHRVTYKSGGRRTQVDYILCRRGNLKEISDCKVVVGESVARQHRMVVCRMTLMVCKTKRSKIEKKTKWWKLKKEECCEEFRQKLRQALGGQVVLPDDWETTAEVIRETGRKVLGVSSGRRKEDKETWWWNEEVQDSIQRKRLAKKKWDMDRTEENRQEYKELQRRVKREVSKAKQKAYEELYTRLDTREGEKDLYRLARQRDRDGKDVQQKVDKIRKDEVRKALKRMKSGKAVGPDDIPVEVWKCLGEAAVEFLANLFNRVLENLEKAYDRVPREELWYCMRKSGVAEKYVRVVQDMYEKSRTVVRCAVGQTEEFNVEVGLHQGSALSPFLFAMVMDQLSEEVRQESPWTMMFADDIVICSESREQVEENLERWREGSGTVRLQGEEVKKVQEFKYLGSTVQSNGECGKEKISARIKGKVYRTVVRAAMLYGLETVSLRKRQESELEVAELKMLREARLRWFGHVQRRDMGARVEDAEDRDRWREMIRYVLRNNRRELQSAARKWKKSKLDTDLISYRTLLSKFSLDLTSAKTSFYKEKLETSAQDPQKLHNIFSSLLNPPAPPSPSSLTAEDFATFYTEKIERICQTFTSLPTSSTSHSQHSTTPSLTQLSTVAAEEVLQITRSCNPTTCPLDPIPSAMLQTISPDLLPFITTVINGSLTSGHVPTVFKKARVIPILKKPALDPSDISNYRPVSLLSFLSNILERVVCNQLSDYLMQNNLHDPNQSGFKAAHSTETALLRNYMLLDQPNCHRSLGICGTAWEWFASYLDGRSYQAVTSTEVQQQDTTQVQIRGAVPPNHAPPGITVVAHMGVEVPQQNYGVPSRSTFQHPSQGLQEGWVLHTAVRPISRNNSETPIPGPKAQGNNPLVYRGKLQHMAAELGGYKQAHPSPTPLTMGHSREEEGLTSLKEENGDIKFLTKGDNNSVDDRGLYKRGQHWLEKKDVVGRARGFVPYIGIVTILMNDYPKFKYAVLCMLGLFVLVHRE